MSNQESDTFGFMITANNELPSLGGKVITNASVGDAHDMAHAIAADWAESHQHLGQLAGQCTTSPSTGMPLVLLNDATGNTICRIEVVAVDLCEPAHDPMDILGQIFGRALQATDMKGAPPEIKMILNRIAQDPNAPAELRDIIKAELGTESAASGVTLH